MSVQEGQVLWEPPNTVKQTANIIKFMDQLNKEKNIKLEDYQDLWEWSVNYLEDYWKFIWDYFNVKYSVDYDEVLKGSSLIETKWFTGSKLNYVENIFENRFKTDPVILSKSEIHGVTTMNWEELTAQVASISTYLRAIGIQPGDRVAAYLPNIKEAVVAFLATASIGAVWSICPPEFGTSSTLSRFKQIEPKVFITVDGYQYNGKQYNKLQDVKEIVSEMDSVKQVIVLPYLNEEPLDTLFENQVNWNDILEKEGELDFKQVPFDHPLWILYSSGTTGLPKAIVHGHGGMLLNNLSGQVIQSDVKPGDRYFWYTTTGWMLWNTIVGSLHGGATIILYDGSPTYPDHTALWKLAEETKMTHLGVSPGFIQSCMKKNVVPKEVVELSKLKTFAYTGAPLSPEGFKWVYDNTRSDIRLIASAGGTDICGPIVSSSPITPVYAGQIPCRVLGTSVYSYDAEGKSVYDTVGEMVITKPIPSMPLYFWGDEENKKYKESYYNKYPDIWRHGDLLKITNKGTAVIYGRSDATINRGGVRTGSSEIYRSVESIPDILDSLVVDLSGYNRKTLLLMFVQLHKNKHLTEELKTEISSAIKRDISPRHLPDAVYAVNALPMTITGKKMEIPVKKILLGEPVESVLNTDSISDPDSIDYFTELAVRLKDKIFIKQT